MTNLGVLFIWHNSPHGPDQLSPFSRRVVPLQHFLKLGFRPEDDGEMDQLYTVSALLVALDDNLADVVELTCIWCVGSSEEKLAQPCPISPTISSIPHEITVGIDRLNPNRL